MKKSTIGILSVLFSIALSFASYGSSEAPKVKPDVGHSIEISSVCPVNAVINDVATININAYSFEAEALHKYRSSGNDAAILSYGIQDFCQRYHKYINYDSLLPERLCNKRNEGKLIREPPKNC